MADEAGYDKDQEQASNYYSKYNLSTKRDYLYEPFMQNMRIKLRTKGFFLNKILKNFVCNMFNKKTKLHVQF